MCRVLGLNKSGYYYWTSKNESSRAIALKAHTKEIIAIYESSKKRYGSYKIQVKLGSLGIVTSRNRVARIMNKAGIKSIVNVKYKVRTTDSDHSNKISLNHLNRNFNPQSASKVWVSDITYIHTEQGWLYLTTVIDLYDRKVIGWSLSDNMTTKDTIIKAWKMAITNRQPLKGMIFHTDRGVQYTSKHFRVMLAKYKVIQSMSRKGNCWDNAVAESFFKIIKSEMIDHKYYYAHFQAKIDIVQFIEVWYNKQRIHASLGYLTPEEFGKNMNINAA
jgi:transposase InsO family protein